MQLPVEETVDANRRIIMVNGLKDAYVDQLMQSRMDIDCDCTPLFADICFILVKFGCRLRNILNLRLLKEMESTPPDDFLTMESNKNAHSSIKICYMETWGSSLDAINFIKFTIACSKSKKKSQTKVGSS
ncbi:hypothetical protein MP228_005532 [Amoeboaphelidium protococcarum]|nr:hypothetical protein MP228_005532 [Amoeboaphelidium protococcarum]